MIRELRIKNFKGWQDTGFIKMAPLTVFFGANSSGKSSIGHLLLTLKQTVDNPDRKTIIFPGGNNSPMQFGSLQNLIYHHNTENSMEFEYLWDLPETIQISDEKNNNKYAGDKMRFSASIKLKDDKSSEVDNFIYELYKNANKALSVSMKKNDSKSSYEIKAEKYKLVRTNNKPWDIGAPVRFYGFPDTIIANHQNADFLQTLNYQHERLFGSIYYLGPLRNPPLRMYQWPGSEPDSAGYSGENSIYAILAAQNRKINMRKKKKKMPFQEVIAKKLKEMGLIEDFHVAPISEGHQTYEVKVRTKNSGDMVNLPDVGFGVSQVLPVLVQLFYAPPKSIIIMEQPEIHLHPSAQAILADVMIDGIMSSEDGDQRGIQLIIESHSEHFLRRLQRRIAENVLSADQIAAYFANANTKPSKLETLQVDNYGNIVNWPYGFFGDEMEDITAQSLAAMKKRAEEIE